MRCETYLSTLSVVRWWSLPKPLSSARTGDGKTFLKKLGPASEKFSTPVSVWLVPAPPSAATLSRLLTLLGVLPSGPARSGLERSLRLADTAHACRPLSSRLSRSERARSARCCCRSVGAVPPNGGGAPARIRVRRFSDASCSVTPAVKLAVPPDGLCVPRLNLLAADDDAVDEASSGPVSSAASSSEESGRTRS